MTIVYVFENTLYLNITNRCTNSCDFCVRTISDGYYSENSLWLEYEPSLDEILTALEKYKFENIDFNKSTWQTEFNIVKFTIITKRGKKQWKLQWSD